MTQVKDIAEKMKPLPYDQFMLAIDAIYEAYELGYKEGLDKALALSNF